jgi:hypothetical protein
MQGTDKVFCHDLEDTKAFDVSPDGILARRYFYEEDSSAPDNRIENLLSKMEGQCSAYFKNLHSLPIEIVRPGNEQTSLKLLQQALSHETCTAIKTFAAYQYLRVPGAIDQKRYELETTSLSTEQKDYLLNAGRFVESGFSYVHNKFQSLKLLVMLSTGQDFITSDWPCFDLKDSDSSPLLGEEIGASPEVVAYLPLTPRLAVILYPSHHSHESGSHLTPPVHVIPCTDSNVRNQNTLVIQQADRYVVANQKKDFIFSVAKKRKKSKNA